MRDDRDRLDEDLFEDLDDEELAELVRQEQKRAFYKEQQEIKKPKRPFPKWAFWLIVSAMLLQLIAFIPKTFSLPAIDFLRKSAKLSLQDDIRAYKKAVVTIETDDSKGTGFAISGDGTIVTNHHVVEGENVVDVAFPEEGLMNGKVEETFPNTDLAIIKTDSEENEKPLPHLKLAEGEMKETVRHEESVYFIGNPLHFHGIANEGEILEKTQLEDWNKPVVMMKAPVYRGNSGSPVINKTGKVIGVVFATLEHDTYGKVGLLIPINYLKGYQDSSSMGKE